MKQLFIIMLSLFFIGTSFAAVNTQKVDTTVCQPQDMSKIKFIKHMYTVLDRFDNGRDPKDLKLLRDMYADNITYVMNRITQAKSIDQFIKTVSSIDKNTTISPLVYKTAIAVKNKVVVQYTTTLVLNQNVFPLDITSIFTFNKDGKISKWVEVVDQTDTFL